MLKDLSPKWFQILPSKQLSIKHHTTPVVLWLVLDTRGHDWNFQDPACQNTELGQAMWVEETETTYV